MRRRVGPCTYPTCDCAVYMPDGVFESMRREICPNDSGDVAWSSVPMGRQIHAMVGGKLLTWDAEAGVLRDEDGIPYSLVIT